MAEIWNLTSLCRCCHSDGNFKSLQEQYCVEDVCEIYSEILRNTFGIIMNQPPIEVSHSICDICIKQLKDAHRFKNQVLTCEVKFDEYCRNELSYNLENVKIEVNVDEQGNIEEHCQTELKFNDTHDYADALSDNQVDVEVQNGKEPTDIVKINLVIKKEGGVKKEKKPQIVPKTKRKGLTRTKGNASVNKLGRKRKRKSAIAVPKPEHIKDDINSPAVKSEQSAEQNLPIKCRNCHKSFDGVKELNRHNRDTHYAEREYVCSICREIFTNKNAYVEHSQVHGREKYRCTFCPKTFFSRHSLKDHELLHINEKPYTCDLCQRRFKYKQSLRRHLGLDHEGTIKKVVCHICGLKFNDKSNFLSHLRAVHEKLKPYACIVCGKAFSTKKILKEHTKRHTGDRAYRCVECDKNYVSTSVLKKHRNMVHGEKNAIPIRKYKCIVCGEKLEGRGAFRKHVRSHTGSLPHKCHKCDKDFSCKYSLRRHILEHSDERPFACDICGVAYKQKSQVYRHKRNVHNIDSTGAPIPPRFTKKVKCDLCKQNVYDMEKHMANHENRPHQCHLCEKRYPEKNALNRHVKFVHLNLKKFQCDLCDKKYQKVESVKRHKLKQHSGKYLKVEIEGDNFENAVHAYSIENRGVRQNDRPVGSNAVMQDVAMAQHLLPMNPYATLSLITVEED